MTSQNGNLWKISKIYKVNAFLSRKSWIPIKIITVKEKIRNPVSIKWVLKNKEEPDGLICLKSRSVVRGYMQVPGVDYTE